MTAPDANLGVETAEHIWTSPLSADTTRMPQAVANPPMIATKLETAGGRSGNVDAAAVRAADWLSLAAAPTFAIMALLTGILGGGMPEMPCSVAHDALPLSGMIPMYLLMSVFHSAPWLKLVSSRRSGARRS